METEKYRKNKPIETWMAGDEYEDVYIIDELTKRTKKNGDPYYSITLADASGRGTAKVWDGIDTFEQRGYRKNDYVLARGRVSEYNGRLDSTLVFMRPLTVDQVDPADFIATSPRPLDELIGEFHGRLDEVEDPQFRELLAAIFDERGQLYRDFIVAPSARTVHQAYLHGLLEHTLNVVDNALRLAEAPHNARLVDRDLLLTGALIHDMGKTVEYTWHPRIDYSEVGLLMGHISIGSNMLAQMARLVEIHPGKVAHLHHLVLSHHGRLEFGSPRLPATPEALILHYADYADAQLAVYEELAEETRRRGEHVSTFSQFIERRVLTLDTDFDTPGQATHYIEELAELARAPRAED